MNEVLITIGTDDYWAPPQKISVGVDDDLEAIRSASPSVWTMVDRGVLTRCAVYWLGQWRRLASPPEFPLTVKPDQRVEVNLLLWLRPEGREIVDVAEGAQVQIESSLQRILGR